MKQRRDTSMQESDVFVDFELGRNRRPSPLDREVISRASRAPPRSSHLLPGSGELEYGMLRYSGRLRGIRVGAILRRARVHGIPSGQQMRRPRRASENAE